MAVQAIRSTDRIVVKRGLMDFTKWKQKAIEMMLQDDELMKLLTYSTNDWNSRENVSQEKREGLLYNQIFPYSYIDNIAKEKKSYIGLSLSQFVKDEGYRRFSNRYVSGGLYVNILCDNGIMNTDLGVRSDLILGRIYQIFQNSKQFGAGEMKMESAIEKWIDNGTHGGYFVAFGIVEME